VVKTVHVHSANISTDCTVHIYMITIVNSAAYMSSWRRPLSLTDAVRQLDCTSSVHRLYNALVVIRTNYSKGSDSVTALRHHGGDCCVDSSLQTEFINHNFDDNVSLINLLQVFVACDNWGILLIIWIRSSLRICQQRIYLLMKSYRNRSR